MRQSNTSKFRAVLLTDEKKVVKDFIRLVQKHGTIAEVARRLKIPYRSMMRIIAEHDALRFAIDNAEFHGRRYRP